MAAPDDFDQDTLKGEKKMKILRKICSLLLVLVMLVSFAVCSADTFGDFEVGATEAGFCILYNYYGEEANVIIPSSFEMYDMDWPVGAISEEAFIYNTDLKTVIIPEGVTDIGYRAFYGCENLERVILPSTVKQIQDEAFAYCTSLKQITMPDYLFYAGEDVFKGCSSLTLSPAQQDALVNTEYAADMAQQAAFVVDTENLIELTPYLGTSFSEYIARFDDMEDLGYTDGTGYANKDHEVGTQWASYSDYEYDSISYIGINRKCNYSLCGIYPTMNGDDAMRILLQNGWMISRKNMQGYSFEDAYGNYIDYWMDDNVTVSSVSYIVSWDISDAIDRGIYDSFEEAMDVLRGGTNISNAETSMAYTTGNVNLRSGPGLGYDTVGSIGSGTYIEYLGDSSIDERGVAWYYVYYNGMTGWSSSKYVDLM